MATSDGMVNMVSCEWGRHLTVPEPAHTPGYGRIGEHHPRFGQRGDTIQPGNHEDGTGRNGANWMSSGGWQWPSGQDARWWLWKHASYETKEGKVAWCDAQGCGDSNNQGIWYYQGLGCQAIS